MENDSPNLFDSEPVSIELTTVADPDAAVSAEIVGAARDGGRPPSVEISVDGGRDAVATEYRTDESDDDNANEDAVGERPADDQSPGERGEGAAVSKTKDVHKGLPPGRVKLIMKMDPDVNIIAADAVFLVTKATESFVALLAQHCHKAMAASNKKTMKKSHIDAVIEENVPFEFLDGALDW